MISGPASADVEVPPVAGVAGAEVALGAGTGLDPGPGADIWTLQPATASPTAAATTAPDQAEAAKARGRGMGAPFCQIYADPDSPPFNYPRHET